MKSATIRDNFSLVPNCWVTVIGYLSFARKVGEISRCMKSVEDVSILTMGGYLLQFKKISRSDHPVMCLIDRTPLGE